MDEPLKRAIDAAGGPVAFAAALGINRQAVWKWKRCPAHRIIEGATRRTASGPVSAKREAEMKHKLAPTFTLTIAGAAAAAVLALSGACAKGLTDAEKTAARMRAEAAPGYKNCMRELDDFERYGIWYGPPSQKECLEWGRALKQKGIDMMDEATKEIIEGKK
jgi:Putative antitoxin of bacterial toxin-antitoxin system, YdaS/YdaT